MDPFVLAGLAELRRQAQGWRSVIEGLPGEALDWRPGPETNSLAVLVTHALGATQAWTARAAGEEIERDREAEFHVSAGVVGLGDLIDTALGRLETFIDRIDPGRYGDELSPSTGGEPLTRARCLIRAIEHDQEHLGQALLTRQLWEQQRPAD